MRLLALVPLSSLLIASGFAQTAPHTSKPHPATQVHPEARPAELPITRVALYKNGVGFFEHSGRVTGDQAVTIDFTSAQLNDVLQSLTAIDLQGGRISGAGYNSTTPLDQQLKTLPLGLADDPSDVDFYNAIRGARVQVTAPGVSMVGRLLSIDLRPEVKKTDADSDAKPDRRFLTVISDAGAVRTLELTSAVTVTLVDTALHTDVTRFLELISNARNEGLRHLTILDRGTGARDLRVSYISEVPVWKSTYRILFTDAKAANATLQGWSVVDNTTGSDWTNVHLDLIAGAPQSFIQPLSTPYYTRRVEVPLPEEAQLAPQTHESGDEARSTPQTTLDGYTGGLQSNSVHGKADKFAGGGLEQLGRGAGQGLAGGVPGGTGTGPAPLMQSQQSNRVEGFARLAAPAPRPVAPPPLDYAETASASLVPQTTTAAFDDFFEYTLTDPITIRKNESALVPILQTKLPIERVTLWSGAQPVALRALWITNSSTLTLDRGSFSIVENGSFGGEGLLDPIHPGERRLLSYAADQAVTVDAKPTTHKQLRSVTIAKGVLTEHYRDHDVRDYSVRNAAAEPRTVLIEHVRNQRFELSPESSSKPEETTPTTYRYRLQVPAHGTVKLKVVETHASPTHIQIGGINEGQIRVLVQELGAGPGANLQQQLQPVLDAQRALADLNGRAGVINGELNRLRGEEERQRANIVALKDADKGAQKRFVDELGRIEDQILEQQRQQEALQKQIAGAQADLANKVVGVTFEQKLAD